jgi:tetratricopeptide (TPR) repeat protein
VKQRLTLLLSRALLDQSKAEDALPVLDEILADPNLSPRNLADAARMRAAAEYLLNRETGERYCEAASKALVATQTLSDPRLTAQALFECARAGAGFGDEDRVRSALSELLRMSEEPGGAENPIVLHALGFCYFFFFELALAASYLERAITVLQLSSDSVTLNYVYNGYGMSKHHLCEFGSAEAAYLAGLDLAQRMGDDSRASIIASNLCGLRCHKGDYAGSIEVGRYSVAAASRGTSQPRVITCYTNLAEAYMLSGETAKGVECIESAKTLVEGEQSWSARVTFLANSASLALLASNIAHALDTIGAMERITWGRERAVPDLGLVERLRIFKVGYTRDAALACVMAQEWKEKFRNRNLMYYLDALSAHAWAERRAHGRLSDQTQCELEVFDIPELAGRKAALIAQGFLT